MGSGAIFILFLLLGACNERNNASGNNEQKIQPESRLFIQNPSDYSDEFIAKFKRKHSRYKIAWLKSDTIFLYGKSERIIPFPVDIELHKTYHYATITEKGYYTLTLNRINYSSIDCKCIQNKKVITKGTVHIDPLFYEPDENVSRRRNEKESIMYTGKNENGERLEILVRDKGKTAAILVQHDTINRSYFMVNFAQIVQ
jgi:hypothetical protein